jgi:hypothetical protein
LYVGIFLTSAMESTVEGQISDEAELRILAQKLNTIVPLDVLEKDRVRIIE